MLRPRGIRALVVLAGLGDPALAERMEPRIGRPTIAQFGLPVDAEGVVTLDEDLAPQPVEREPPDQFVGSVGLAVE